MTIAKIGIIRVVSSNDQSFIETHQRLLQPLLPDYELASRALPDQPEGIHDATTFAQALPKIRQMANQWQHELDLLMISCAADPGVKMLQSELSIPVVGAGESCARKAARYGDHIAILGIEADAPAIFYEILAGKTIHYRCPEGIHCTHDIQTPAGKQAIIAAALECEALGANVIALACTGMATTDVAALLAPHTSLTVINPVLAAAELINIRLTLP
ncbi:aspartate/glutamate racemase family protein [Celerinatantimonas sp. YJH-8]|uniref:aspartate/glutamate racemase family protein n=1 Tax=Celerinatantimonas sp. YJH-8 TaxID=3228714 RepID=UPI0038C9B186